MDDFKPNSFKSKEPVKEQKNIAPVVQGGVTMREESKIVKEAKGIGSYVFKDVISPLLKKIAYDSFTTALNMTLYPDGNGPRTTSGGAVKANSRQSYNSIYDDTRVVRSVSTYVYEPLEFDRRADAEDVLSQLKAIIRQYGIASVSDYYQTAGIRPRTTDENYGWTNINNAYVKMVGDKFTIILPKPLPIN